MSIKIFTYQDPYQLPNETFWGEIITCPYFCASQTLASGLKAYYGKDFARFGTRTVKKLIDSLYTWWESTNCAIKQNALIDNLINRRDSRLDFAPGEDNILRAFLFNREEVFNSIRTLCELDVNAEDILSEKLAPEQSFIVSLYKAIQQSSSADLFTPKKHFSEDEINGAIAQALDSGSGAPSLSMIPDRIVIHGVHQFSPIMLRAIEEIARFKDIILLFCYQPQFASIYQSWIDVYSAFDCPITISSFNVRPPALKGETDSQSNVLACDLGMLSEGKLSQIKRLSPYEIVEFDNMTEFAGYVASVFEAAKRVSPERPMRVMKEQFYSADPSVNEILKIYFPDQFGERQFLNYPLGHFFIAIANMWDIESNSLYISDISSVRECFMSGILAEDYQGELSTLFEKAVALFDGCTTIEEMTSRLDRIKGAKRTARGKRAERVSRISYCSLSNNEISKLRDALVELKDLSEHFYKDFEREPNNFRSFYERLKEYLHDEILGSESLDREFEDIVRRVYQRIEEVDDINASASFECLKSTMSIYLTQQEKRNEGADWIARGFEQIDGDIMLSARKTPMAKDVIYHFACLSDEDINSIAVNDFTWPLDDEFFTVAQNPVDWKCQVFVKSRKEYRHFKPYALLFGLEFNHAKFKLSYVKRDGEKKKSPYSRLLMLGAKVKPYSDERFSHRLGDVGPIEVGVPDMGTYAFGEMDYYRFKMCEYRFLLESLIEKGSVYKDAFLLSKYMEALLENMTKKSLEGCAAGELTIREEIDSNIDGLIRYFPFVRFAAKSDAVNSVRKRLVEYSKRGFPDINDEQQRKMQIREEFLHWSLKDKNGRDATSEIFKKSPSVDAVERLRNEISERHRFNKESGVWCTYCPNREICIEQYAE